MIIAGHYRLGLSHPMPKSGRTGERPEKGLFEYLNFHDGQWQGNFAITKPGLALSKRPDQSYLRTLARFARWKRFHGGDYFLAQEMDLAPENNEYFICFHAPR